MVEKNRKLQNQFEAEASTSSHGGLGSVKPIFDGVSIFVDGFTVPSSQVMLYVDMEVNGVPLKVFDEDIAQDKRLGIAKLTLNDLEAETEKVLDLRLQPSLDMLEIKDKKDRGTLTVKVLYHKFNKEEQLAALEEKKMILEARKKLKEAGVIGITMDAIDGAATLVGSGVGFVGTSLGAGVGLMGSGVGAGVGLVGTGL